MLSHISQGKRFIIVHGEKLNKKCEPRRELLSRLEKAIELANRETFDGIIVAGGQTRKKCSSEASFGAEYLKKRNVHVPVFIEERSHTTIENIVCTNENIVCTKELFAGCSPQKLIVISSKKRIFRLRYLYRRLWPDVYNTIDFVGAPDSYGVHFYFLEMLYAAYSMFDGSERFLSRLAKKIFRNGS